MYVYMLVIMKHFFFFLEGKLKYCGFDL